MSTTIAVQGQEPFAVAPGGGDGVGNPGAGVPSGGGLGASGGGAAYWQGDPQYWSAGAPGIPGYGHKGAANTSGIYGGGGGYGGPGGEGGYAGNGGAAFDLAGATALNLDPNDGLTGTFLDLVSVDGWIAGGGSTGGTGVAVGGGGLNTGHAKAFTGSGGGGNKADGEGNATGGCGAVYIITDPT